MWDSYDNNILNAAGRSNENKASGGNQGSPLKWEKEAGTGFTTFKQCYDANYKDKATTDDINMQKMKEFLEQGGWKFLNMVEQEFNCASVCPDSKALFYATVGIDKGMAT